MRALFESHRMGAPPRRSSLPAPGYLPDNYRSQEDRSSPHKPLQNRLCYVVPYAPPLGYLLVYEVAQGAGQAHRYGYGQDGQEPSLRLVVQLLGTSFLRTLSVAPSCSPY